MLELHAAALAAENILHAADIDIDVHVQTQPMPGATDINWKSSFKDGVVTVIVNTEAKLFPLMWQIKPELVMLDAVSFAEGAPEVPFEIYTY